MGQDDRNEGHGAGECVEHAFKLRGVTLTLEDGATEDYECLRCGAWVVKKPDRGPGSWPTKAANRG